MTHDHTTITLPADLPIRMARWGLVRTGEPPVRTATSILLPVLRDGMPAMLKLSHDPDEQRGNDLMAWWRGTGAAPVLDHDREAILLERAITGRSLADMVDEGDDTEATRQICHVAGRLHGHRAASRPTLRLLDDWFRDFTALPPAPGDWLARCAASARALLADPREPVALHGDLHHGNVLEFGAKGWRAIDPKGLFGERTFDFAALFLNPDLAGRPRRHADLPNIFAQRVDLVAQTASLDRTRLVQWIHAWCGLSALWFLEDGAEPVIQHRIALHAEKFLTR
ncbi:aminoglycoside phosphotransferase family protein [Gluconacetobacter sp. Hr-1-5]|uniref:aminoglycoside phosphotransferase family protein n=1 Tax=Gluconacetobacter sp. Hr-1-5 TaxID=3395370 RepID=UPI003B521CFC